MKPVVCSITGCFVLLLSFALGAVEVKTVSYGAATVVYDYQRAGEEVVTLSLNALITETNDSLRALKNSDRRRLGKLGQLIYQCKLLLRTSADKSPEAGPNTPMLVSRNFSLYTDVDLALDDGERLGIKVRSLQPVDGDSLFTPSLGSSGAQRELWENIDDPAINLRQLTVNVLKESDVISTAENIDKMIGAMAIEWEGESITMPQANQKLQDPNRETRERAWRLIMARYAQDREALDELYIKMLKLRRQVARNAGFDSFRAYQWQALNRFDYTPEDCFTFHDAIEHEVVPVARKYYAELQKALNLDSLRPWDTKVDPSGQPLKPFSDAAELEEVSHHIFQQVDPVLAQHFAVMRESHLDLASRANKAPGGYCNSFPASKKPYIFMNAVGTHDDVTTLLHEGGHAFHFMESSAQPLVWNHNGPMEFCEVASMAMELLSAPYLTKEQGGFYNESDMRRAYTQKLLDTPVFFLPYMAVVDAFQHWVYADAPEEVTAADLDAKWSELWDRFMVGIDYSGLQNEKESGWHRKLHIFTVPFYYIEYGLAQIGALQVWRNAMKDQAQAVADYRAALALGDTRPLPDLFRAAGATFAFDRQVVGELMGLVNQQLEQLEIRD